MSRIKDIGIWNPRIRTVGIRNPDGWNPESRGLESGIQGVGIRNPRPLWILLHGAIRAFGLYVCFTLDRLS